MSLPCPRPRKKVTLLFNILYKFCVSRVAPTGASTASLPSHLSSQPGGSPPACAFLPPLRRQEQRAGLRDNTWDPETTCGANQCQSRCTRDFILSCYMIKQVITALQGPKLKTRVRIVFKIFEGFKTYLAYINPLQPAEIFFLIFVMKLLGSAYNCIKLRLSLKEFLISQCVQSIFNQKRHVKFLTCRL